MLLLYKMKKLIFILMFLSILLGGCATLNFTQELDLTPNNKLIISAKVSGDSEIRQVNDAIKEISCKFDIDETEKDSSTYLTYTSDDCKLSGVTIIKIGDDKYKYSFDSSYFSKYSSSISSATYIIKIKGQVLDTNGINVGNNQVKFLISTEDIGNRYVYYVDYELYCESNSDCNSEQSCKNNKCVQLDCGTCQYIEEHKCKSYDCCQNEDCGNAQYCKNHECIDVKCEFNQHAENHICVWNCVENINCNINEICTNHSCYELKCLDNEGFSNHTCKLLECKEEEYIENHECKLLSCKEDETPLNHKCSKLNCSFLKKPLNHQCIFNNNWFFSLLFIIIAFCSISFYLIRKYKKHKRIKK